jgi:hypothetical protein
MEQSVASLVSPPSAPPHLNALSLLLAIPIDCCCLVFQLVDPQDLFALALTCSALRRTLHDRAIWCGAAPTSLVPRTDLRARLLFIKTHFPGTWWSP